jgi:hypothetical protein
MHFKNIGSISVSQNGEIIDKPRDSDVKYMIQENLKFVRTNVEKALIKTAANKFSILPFSEHMYSPIIDVIANLLVNDKMDISQDIGQLREKEREKYTDIIKNLTSIGLIKQEDGYLEPDNAFVELERGEPDLHKQLSKILAYYFTQYYDDLEGIHRIVGPHLTIAGFIYQQSIEYGAITPVRYDEIRRLIIRSYRDEELKLIKIPRYLIQLNNVDIIKMKPLNGEDTWEVNSDIFEDVNSQEDLISPLNKMFFENEIPA